MKRLMGLCGVVLALGAFGMMACDDGSSGGGSSGAFGSLTVNGDPLAAGTIWTLCPDAGACGTGGSPQASVNGDGVVGDNCPDPLDGSATDVDGDTLDASDIASATCSFSTEEGGEDSGFEDGDFSGLQCPITTEDPDLDGDEDPTTYPVIVEVPGFGTAEAEDTLDCGALNEVNVLIGG